MYWPPKWIANNRVTLDDKKYAVEEALPVRHPEYAQSAAVLSPWLSWADIDARWNASDPMMRVLLIGEPGVPLRCVNVDTHGTIIRLGDPPLGDQAWEVVSFFDWYEDGFTNKVGCMAWCRLYEYPWPAPAAAFSEELLSADGTVDDHTIVVSDIAAEALVVVCIAFDGHLNACTAMTIDGVAMTLAKRQTAPVAADAVIEMWYAVRPATVAPVVHATFAGTCTVSGRIIHITGATQLDSLAAVGGTAAASGTPGVSQDVANTEEVCYVVYFCGTVAPDPGLTWDAPVADIGTVSVNSLASLAGFEITSTLVTPSGGISVACPDLWCAIVASFR